MNQHGNEQICTTKHTRIRRSRRSRRKTASHWIDLSSTVRRRHSNNHRILASCSSRPSCLINHVAGESQLGTGHPLSASIPGALPDELWLEYSSACSHRHRLPLALPSRPREGRLRLSGWQTVPLCTAILVAADGNRRNFGNLRPEFPAGFPCSSNWSLSCRSELV